MSESSQKTLIPDSSKLFGHHGPPPERSLLNRIRRKLPRLEDFVLDRVLEFRIASIKRSPAFQNAPRRNILAVGVQSPRRPAALSQLFERLSHTKHNMNFEEKPIDGLGKLENVNILLSRYKIAEFDWVFMIDDDVWVPKDFIDIFIALAESADLKIAGPAHRAKSHLSYPLTWRRYDSLVRETSFVEVGPITAFQKDALTDVFPLPNLRYGWGLDLTWPALARRRGWRIGIVDAVPIEHLYPVAATYDTSAAADEALDFLTRNEFLPREEYWKDLRKWSRFPADP